MSQTANLSNWRTAPFSRWAFQHVADLVPTAPIAPSAAPRPLGSGPADVPGFSLSAPGGRTLDFAAFLDATETDAMVVVHNGEVVCETYAHGMGPHSPHILMSATKSVTGLIAGMLIGDGLLDPETPLSVYLPELAATSYETANLRHLLDMRAGVAFSPDDLKAYAEASGWDPAPEGAPGLHDFFAGLSAPVTERDGPFRYLSPNIDLLGWVIERASGRRLADLVSERLWGPMGAEDPAAITLDREGAPRATGGMITTARDLARLGLLIQDGGVRDGVQIVPASWMTDMASGGDPAAWRAGDWAPLYGKRTVRYRSCWYMIDEDPPLMFAMGIHGQNLFVDRRNALVIAKLSSQANAFDPGADYLTHAAVREIRRLVCA